MITFTVGQNFKFEKELYKIIKIANGGIDTLNMDTGEKRDFRFFDFVKYMKDDKIVFQKNEKENKK